MSAGKRLGGGLAGEGVRLDSGAFALDAVPVPLYDMHCHLGFSENMRLLADVSDARAMAGTEHATRAQGVGGALSVTVAPAEYELEAARWACEPRVRVGLGLHPWWVADGRCGSDAVARFEELAAEVRFIGEVGLDFSARWAGSEERQRAVFARAVEAALVRGRKVFSLHAVRAADEVMDTLEGLGAVQSHACVFHWFSGTSDQLQRALSLGCFFSVGERMLATKRGRAYARAISQERLLLETDYPDQPESFATYGEWVARLERALHLLAEARGEDARRLAECLGRNAAALLE